MHQQVNLLAFSHTVKAFNGSITYAFDTAECNFMNKETTIRGGQTQSRALHINEHSKDLKSSI